MRLITNILFPVDFSPSSIAMAAYVKRAATLFGAKVSLVHVFDPSSYNAFELYVRPASELAEEHEGIARDRLNSFLAAEFPLPSTREFWFRVTPPRRSPTSLGKIAST
jgi:nucleotide-binding universal stress UspA family protein